MAPATGHDLSPPHAHIIPAAPNRRVRDVFVWYARRLARKRFHALHLEAGGAGSMDVLRTLQGERRPLLIAVNHSSWWDPMVGVLVGARFCRERTHLAPMDSVQLRRFSFFRRLGLFGIDPDSPASMDAMLAYVLDRFRSDPSPTLWITPQGEFTDVRDPVHVRPGLAALASRLAGSGVEVRMVSLAIEYAFWQDARPELFVRAAEIAPPGVASTAGWQRTIAAAMQGNADALAALVRTRDPEAFTDLLGGPERAETKVHPVYDMYLKLTGRSGRLTTRAERLSEGGSAEPGPFIEGGRP